MTQHLLAPIRKYHTLEDFIKGQNNFYLHFIDDCYIGEIYRKRPHFRRFKKQYPRMEQEITKETVRAIRANPRCELPYKKLWEAYKIMSKLVFLDDEYVMRNGKPDAWFLCR